MQPSSLVFVAIVVGWAAYLVPQWVRRRDALGQFRGRDRDSDGIRVLSRRQRPASGGAADGRSAPSLLTAPGRPGTSRHAGPSRQAGIGVILPSGAREAARRRVRVLLVLLTLTAGSWSGVAMALFSWWTGAVCTVLLALDVLALRASARRRARQRLVAAARAERRAQRQAALASLRTADPRLPRHPVYDDHLAARADVVPSVAEASALAGDSGTWVPVPVPPPTYTLKPVVHRPEPVPFVVDELPANPNATSASLAEADAANGTTPPRPWDYPDRVESLDLDAVLARRRAVNG